MSFSMIFLLPYVLAAGGGSSAVTAPDWADVISAVTAQFSVVNIVGVMTAIVVAGIGFVFLWWGARKAYKAIMSAVRKGKTGF